MPSKAPVVVTSQSHAPQRTAGTVQQSTYYPPQQGTAPPGGLNYTPQQGMYPPQTAPYPPQTLPYPSAQQPAMPQPQAPYPVHENAPVVGVQPPI
uniref:Uncharacterized protein n=1 Tax=Megaselia scalaris TaxID=36166 RepID=T1GR56_MEGSC